MGERKFWGKSVFFVSEGSNNNLSAGVAIFTEVNFFLLSIFITNGVSSLMARLSSLFILRIGMSMYECSLGQHYYKPINKLTCVYTQQGIQTHESSLNTLPPAINNYYCKKHAEYQTRN